MMILKNNLVFRILLGALMLFAVVRVALYGVYRDYFADASLWTAMWQGTRFDARLVVLALSPFLLVLVLPFGKLNSARWRQVCAWACAGVLFALLGLAVADIAYFGEVQRHIGGELLNIGGDMGFIVETALGTRWAYTLGGVVLLACAGWAWHRWVMPATAPVSASMGQRGVMAFATLLLLVFLARGMVLTGKPLNTVDAFNGTGQAQANLTLNGVWVTWQAVRQRSHQQPLDYVDNATAQQWAQRYPQPFAYSSHTKASGKNVVFILLESWSYRYIDALSGNHYGVTPYVDSLVGKSQVWDNFYAVGQRSILGIQASLTSVPTLPDRQPIGFGLELNNMSRIAELAGKRGYRTLMAQSSKRRSFHMDGIAKTLGFQEYYGQEDVPLLRQYPQDTPPFGWDYDTLQFFGKQISTQSDKPFFAFLFTGTTHEPFADAGAEFNRYPHHANSEQGFLNTLAYSDWALREFMHYAEQQPWYRNTLFVFTADHVLNHASTPTSIRDRFHIPLIIFDPSNPAPQRHTRLSSQYDLLPTFADILGVEQTVSTFGSSLLNPNAPVLPIMLNQGSSTAMIAPNGDTAEFEGKQIISGNAHSPELSLLQWRMQRADEALRANQWAK